jgi:hypothetical protein
MVKEEVWSGVLSWCNSQFFCSQSSGRSLRTFLKTFLLFSRGIIQKKFVPTGLTVSSAYYCDFYGDCVKKAVTNILEEDAVITRMRNWLLGLSRRFFLNNPSDVKEHDEYALDFALDLSRLFRTALNRVCHSNTHVRLMHFSLERLSNICQGLRRTFSEICTKFDAVLLFDSWWNRIRPDSRLQKKKYVKIPTYASTIVCRFTVVLQLLYRRQQQSRKLWIHPCMSVVYCPWDFWADQGHCPSIRPTTFLSCLRLYLYGRTARISPTYK